MAEKSSAAITEYSFSINDFNEPKEYENAKAVMVILTRLLLLEPGTISSHPEMGVGLVSRFRYTFDVDAYQLQSDIRLQIDKYLPQFVGAQVRVEVKGHSFNIQIMIDDAVFIFMYDIENSKLVQDYKRLDDL